MAHQLFALSDAVVRKAICQPRIAIGASGIMVLVLLRSAAALVLHQPI